MNIKLKALIPPGQSVNKTTDTEFKLIKQRICIIEKISKNCQNSIHMVI